MGLAPSVTVEVCLVPDASRHATATLAPGSRVASCADSASWLLTATPLTAVMVAPTVGINPLDPMWIATLVGIVTVSSAGVAGVGGGATFAALIVLPAMGLPVTLVALLISVEPLIDMGRTALNVNGSMTAGTLTSQWLRQTDKSIFDSEEEAELAHR